MLPSALRICCLQRPSSYQCKATGANGDPWTAPPKTLSQARVGQGWHPCHCCAFQALRTCRCIQQLTQISLTLLAQVSISDDGKTTSFDITSTDVAALATTKQRWAVQCKPINPWTASVDWSITTHAASGGRERACVAVTAEGRASDLRSVVKRPCTARMGN